jgi:hypothetical protein
VSHSRLADRLAERLKRVKRVISYPPPFPFLDCGADKCSCRKGSKLRGIADHALHALHAPPVSGNQKANPSDFGDYDAKHSRR